MTTLINTKHTQKELAVLIDFDTHISNDHNDVSVKLENGLVIFHILGYEIQSMSYNDYIDTLEDIKELNK